MRTRKFLSTLIPALPMLLAALLVILVTVIFLTAMRSKAHAQFGGAEQPMFQMTSTAGSDVRYPETVAGIAYYWVYSDIPTNWTHVTNWVDRIRGSIWTNQLIASCPVNTSTGVWFESSSSHWMTNELGVSLGLASGDGSNAHWVIYRLPFVNTGRTLLWANDDTRLGGVDGSGSTGSRVRLSYGTTPSSICTPEPVSTNVWLDVMINTTDGGAPTETISYTNGMGFFTNTVCGAIPGDTSWNRLGRQRAAAFYFRGTIKEIAIYTNTLSLTTISNLNWYHTNTYGIP